MKKVNAKWAKLMFKRSQKPIVIAPQSRTQTFSKEIRLILDAIGHPEAWISDESKFYDFAVDDQEVKELSSKLKVKIKDSDYLVDVAERMAKLH